MYDVYHQAPGAAEFALIAEDVLAETHVVTGLAPTSPPDQHGFYVRESNATMRRLWM